MNKKLLGHIKHLSKSAYHNKALMRVYSQLRRFCTLNKRIVMIAAVDNKGGIGYKGRLPWSLPPDLRRFKRLTNGGTVIMGRRTFESLNSRPLPNRTNIIVTKNQGAIHNKSVLPVPTIDDAILIAKTLPSNNQRAWVIGGEQIYREVYDRGLYDDIELTRVYKSYVTDTRFPQINQQTHELLDEGSVKTYDGLSYQYLHYHRVINPEESAYLKLLREVCNADVRQTRNGLTRSIFQPPRLDFDLRNGFPALTTKRMWVRGVLMELQWYLSGSVDSKDLSRRGCHVWDANTTRKFLNNRGLKHFDEGEIGETYGFLFRHFGAEYYGKDFDYDGHGFDQLVNVVDKIRNDPTDRRLIINLFKPDALDNCALPPCLCWYQFYVDTRTSELDLFTYIRSSDIVLGLPWNIVTGGLLCELVARVTGLKARRLVVGMGDAHIYDEHVDTFRPQLERDVRKFPQLTIDTDVCNINDIIWLDPKKVTLKNYKPHASIKADMVA